MPGHLVRNAKHELARPPGERRPPPGRGTTSMADPGASSAGLRMTAHPAATGAPSLRPGFAIGKFHGAKAATGPTGSFITSDRVPLGRTRTRP